MWVICIAAGSYNQPNFSQQQPSYQGNVGQQGQTLNMNSQANFGGGSGSMPPVQSNSPFKPASNQQASNGIRNTSFKPTLNQQPANQQPGSNVMGNSPFKALSPINPQSSYKITPVMNQQPMNQQASSFGSNQPNRPLNQQPSPLNHQPSTSNNISAMNQLNFSNPQPSSFGSNQLNRPMSTNQQPSSFGNVQPIRPMAANQQSTFNNPSQQSFNNTSQQSFNNPPQQSFNNTSHQSSFGNLPNTYMSSTPTLGNGAQTMPSTGASASSYGGGNQTMNYPPSVMSSASLPYGQRPPTQSFGNTSGVSQQSFGNNPSAGFGMGRGNTQSFQSRPGSGNAYPSSAGTGNSYHSSSGGSQGTPYPPAAGGGMSSMGTGGSSSFNPQLNNTLPSSYPSGQPGSFMPNNQSLYAGLIPRFYFE